MLEKQTFNRGIVRFIVSVLIVTATAAPHAYTQESPQRRAALEHFEKRIRPLLAEHCYGCHSADAEKLKAGLRVDNRGGMLQGGDSGAAVVPGDPDGSLLIESLRYESYEMPPNGKLDDQEIAAFERWVREGAVWPDEDTAEVTVDDDGFDIQQRVAEHWVWQPPRRPRLPSVKRPEWPKDDLDRFILAALESSGLRPSGQIDRAGLLRRLCFDLTGLPPTPEQIRSFLSDERPDAIERAVDTLLDSPHFGERWARHWLDLVRYAESRGHEFDDDARNAFQYRDYAIRAFNADVPYDQFVREHLAGDLLQNPRLHPQQGFNESILGTGFWFLGEWVHSPVDVRKDEADRFDNMIDVMSKAFLGVTVACARCHDHKFDPIATADYYALSGYLQSCDYRQVRFESIRQNRQVAEQLKALDAEYRDRIAAHLAADELSPPAPPELDSALLSDVVVDYGSLAPEHWIQDGFSFGPGPRRYGEPYLEHTDAAPSLGFRAATMAVNDPFWNGLVSISEPGVHRRNKLAQLPRSGRTLRTPTFTLTDGELACLVRGSGNVVACVDSHRLVAGPLHGETIRSIKANERVVRMNLSRYLGHRIHLEFTPAEQATLSVTRVTVGASPQTVESLLQYETMCEQRIDAFAETARAAIPPALIQEWFEQRAQLASRIQRESQLAMAMLDGTGEEDHLLIRGNASKPGRQVPRQFLTAISGEGPMPIESGSGRLQLARAINASDNPLTHRVIVNRIWQHLMGRGIVPTPDDFGVLGQRPTHPDLLDHLAIRFLDNGRSIKSLIRTIVLSRTYQMSGVADPAALRMDPNNLLWHHRPPQRLEGEAIRDALLAISGQLDRTPFGPPVPIHLTNFMDGRGRPGKSGPLDGDRRRSIYIAVRRNFLSPFMLAFDTPAPFSCMGRRTTSNVPAQALILMNDPFVLSQAEAWAQRLHSEPGDVDRKIVQMYLAAFGRAPSDEERSVAGQFISAQPASQTAWRDLAHALINMKEFIFVR